MLHCTGAMTSLGLWAWLAEARHIRNERLRFMAGRTTPLRANEDVTDALQREKCQTLKRIVANTGPGLIPGSRAEAAEKLAFEVCISSTNVWPQMP
ncbi:hypothetical protein BDR22DRAFT_852107 [Usnea florida]